MKRLFGLALLLLTPACEPFNLDSFIYNAKKAPAEGYDLSTAIIPAFEEMTVKTTDGEDIFAVWVPGAGPRNDITLMYARGQGGHLGDSWPRLEFLYPTGFNLVAMDYRGFGRSSGSPSEAGIRLDMRAVREEIIAHKGVDPEKIVYYGRSLGGAVMIDLASVEPPAVLIEESTFTSIQALIKDGANADVPVSALATERWDNLAKIGSIESPFLVLHGDVDDYVPPKYGQQLHDAHPGPKNLIWVKGADHSDVPQKMGEEAYWRTVKTFAEEFLPPVK